MDPRISEGRGADIRTFPALPALRSNTNRHYGYPVPTDGPVGTLLEVLDRDPMRAAHSHLRVSADGYEPLVTQLYDADCGYLETDVVFGRRETLVTRLEPAEDGVLRARFDVRLAGAG